MGIWYEDKEFWEMLGPVMFTKERRLQAEMDVRGLISLLDLEE